MSNEPIGRGPYAGERRESPLGAVLGLSLALVCTSAFARARSGETPSGDGNNAQIQAEQRAVFAVFLASQDPLDTALSVSNILAAPPGISEVFEQRFSRFQGTLEFFLWDRHGHLIHYETDPFSPGIGLSDQGLLGPGQTYRVLLSEVLEAADYKSHAREFGHAADDFSGYGWIVANFDGVQGTCTMTDFSTLSVTTVMQPDLGSTFFDYDASAGVPINKGAGGN